MGTVRKTIRLTEETAAELERRHEALVAAGKSETLSDTIAAILRSRDQEAPSQVIYKVMDKASLADLRDSLVEETRLSALTLIRETIRAEIHEGFRSFLNATRRPSK